MANSAEVKKRILIVEDSPPAALMQKSILSKLDCEVDCVTSGEEGVVLNGKNKYDLILMDIGLPGIDGIEASRQIRAINSVTPIVAVTANLNKETQTQCFEVGMNDALQKPLTQASAQDIIMRFCSEKAKKG